MFVLMMENRSYDNIFGFSDLQGWTPDGVATKADGLVGKPAFTNKDGGNQTHPVAPGAPFRLKFDPGHEFSDTLAQLCGVNSVSVDDCKNDAANMAKYANLPLAATPNDLGFAYDLGAHGFDAASALRCFTPDQLPVLNFLAHQFAVCDRWFSSMPGPTWPNRFFALAGTSWGLDHSPSDVQVVEADVFDGDAYGNGSDSLFTRLAPEEWLLAYGDVPQAWALKGIRAHRDRFVKHADLLSMLQAGTLDANFVFIEPQYDSGLNGTFSDGESMHPLGDVRSGEALIETMYNAIKNSQYWEECVFLIVFDEHGGFFDHVIPSGTTIPADKQLVATAPTSQTQRGFKFDRYGFRVPAIVISPYVKQGTIDHSFYDHLSITKTLNLIVDHQNPPLLDTARFLQADDFGKLLSLENPRASGDIPPCPHALSSATSTISTVVSKTAAAFSKLGWQS